MNVNPIFMENQGAFLHVFQSARRTPKHEWDHKTMALFALQDISATSFAIVLHTSYSAWSALGMKQLLT